MIIFQLLGSFYGICEDVGGWEVLEDMRGFLEGLEDAEFSCIVSFVIEMGVHYCQTWYFFQLTTQYLRSNDQRGKIPGIFAIIPHNPFLLRFRNPLILIQDHRICVPQNKNSAFLLFRRFSLFSIVVVLL